MREPIEVVYENGVFRPLGPLPGQIREHQHLNNSIILEDAAANTHWLDDADPIVSLEAVRRALAKLPGTLAQAVQAEREER